MASPCSRPIHRGSLNQHGHILQTISLFGFGFVAAALHHIHFADDGHRKRSLETSVLLIIMMEFSALLILNAQSSYQEGDSVLCSCQTGLVPAVCHPALLSVTEAADQPADGSPAPTGGESLLMESICCYIQANYKRREENTAEL